MIIETEEQAQKIARAVLLDGVCTEEEFFLWEQEPSEGEQKENSLGVMQVYAITQRVGRSADKYDAILSAEEDFLAQKRNAIWRQVRAGKLEEAEKAVAEYEDFLDSRTDSETNFGRAFRAAEEGARRRFPADLQTGMPNGEKSLQRQFLALSRAEIARREALPYQEQIGIILGGLQQTIPEAAWEKHQGKLWPSREWFSTRRLHLMEQFLLARFARIWECMGMEEKSEEAFLWYQELAAYVCTTAKDQADKRKLHPLLCKMEEMRLLLMRRIPLFGEYTAEEMVFHVLGRAWEGLCQAAALSGIAVDEESHDLDYMERSIHNFQELLGRRMELHGWSVYELGDEIYADPMKSLTPILEGRAEPKPKKRKALQNKLGIKSEKYDPGFLTDDDAEYKKYARMARAYNEGRIEEGRKLLGELEEKMDWGYMTNEQFTQYWEALFDWKSGEITEEEKNKEMWKILEYSGVKRGKFDEVGCSLTKTEWRALTEIAWNHEGEDLAFLCRVMKKQKEYLEGTGREGFFPEYYIKTLYSLCHFEREMGNADEAERYANEGLAGMYRLNLYTQWGAFLFEKFRIVEDRKQGKMEEGDFEYIRQSYAVESLFLKNNAFCEYIERYLNDNYEQNILADMRGERGVILRL